MQKKIALAVPLVAAAACLLLSGDRGQGGGGLGAVSPRGGEVHQEAGSPTGLESIEPAKQGRTDYIASSHGSSREGTSPPEQEAKSYDGHQVLFRVVDSLGSPIRNAVTSLPDFTGPESRALSNELGECQLRIPESNDSVWAVTEAAGYASRSTYVRPRSTQEIVTLAFTHGLTGRVVDDESGAGLSRAKVLIQHSGLVSDPELVIADSDGVFGPVQVPAGELLVLTAESLGYVRHQGRYTPVVDGEAELLVALEPARPLACRFLDFATGDAIAGVEVSTFGAIASGWVSDSQGRTVINSGPLAPLHPERGRSLGKSYFAAMAEGYCDVRFRVDLEAWDGSEVEVRLVQECVIDIRAEGGRPGVSQARAVVVSCRSIQVDHASWDYDRTILPWPEDVFWAAGRLDQPISLELPGDGLVRLENIPVGLVGIDVHEAGGLERLLASSGSFSVPGENRVLTVGGVR